MPDPTANELLERLVSVHRELAEELSNYRAGALVEAPSAAEWSVEFTERRLLMVQEAISEVSVETLGAEGADGLAAQLVEEAYQAGVNVTDAGLAAQGAAAEAAAFESLHIPQARMIAQELTDASSVMYQNLLRAETDRYRSIQARGTIEGMLKGETASDTAGRMMQEFRKADIKTFVGRDNRVWALEDYTEMLGRTVGMKASRQGALNRTVEAGVELGIVVGGETAGTCETCAEIDGKIIDLTDGDHPEADYTLAEIESMSPAYGHPRCNHQVVPWIPDAGPDAEGLRKLEEEVSAEMGWDLMDARGAAEAA